MTNKYLKNIFVFECIIYILIILLLFTELNEIFPISPVWLFLLFSPLGLIQFFLTKKHVKNRKLRIQLMANGLSSFLVMIFAVLHNLFYALSELIGKSISSSIFVFLEGTSFVMALVLCPIVFLVTAIFSIISYSKAKNRE